MLPASSRSTVRIVPYLGYRDANRVRLRARALRGKAPKFDGKGSWRAVRTLIGQYASREVEGVEVRLEIVADGGARHHMTAVTDKEGYADFDLTLAQPWPLPPHTSWDIVTLHWSDGAQQREVDAQVLAPGADERLAVISDVDDTIIETGITGGLRSVLRNWRRLFAQLPAKRSAVGGAARFYGALGGGGVASAKETEAGDRLPATHRPFFYVSSSPWNLFGYLVAFKQAKGLPLGPLMLRDWGLNRETFGKSSHGAHKQDAISGLLEFYPDTGFALVGDDTQGDLPAYAAIAARHPGRISAVFIRSAGQPHSPEEVTAIGQLNELDVPVWTGSSYDVGQDFLRTLGFTPGGETERLIEATEGEARKAEQ